MIRISLTPSVVVEVEAQKMSLLSSVLYCISHPSFLFTYKNLHAARLASSESTNKRRTQKKPLIPKVQNGLFQARISLLAKCPSNQEDSSLTGYLTKERGGGNEKWDPTV